ncbi:hypothetical protein CC2G_002340 [Coprinopsis cinerea AmutBmut pab1-1]|nr:hypothetical protein CC2G_002340 [Coprinopsis cinerea AmutBmut pab1-1]
MAPVAFTGALAPKKKSELQDIATALNISDQGTKDDLQTRIKKHLDNNPELEEDAKFAGLYARGRRRGSVAPTGLKAPPSTASEKPRSSLRIAPLDPIRESTPPHDLRDVSMALKQPVFSSPPSTATPQASPAKSVASPAAPITAMADNEGSPSVLPSLPPSPAKSIIEVISKPQQIIPAVQEKLVTQEIIHNGHEYLEATREFLSNSQNLWTLTALFEFGYIWYTVIPWAYFAVSFYPMPLPCRLANPHQTFSNSPDSPFTETRRALIIHSLRTISSLPNLCVLDCTSTLGDPNLDCPCLRWSFNLLHAPTTTTSTSHHEHNSRLCS